MRVALPGAGPGCGITTLSSLPLRTTSSSPSWADADPVHRRHGARCHWSRSPWNPAACRASIRPHLGCNSGSPPVQNHVFLQAGWSQATGHRWPWQVCGGNELATTPSVRAYEVGVASQPGTTAHEQSSTHSRVAASKQPEHVPRRPAWWPSPCRCRRFPDARSATAQM